MLSSLGDVASQDSGRIGDVQSVHRALDLLEVVARTGEIGVSELAREVGLAVSTVHSLVRTLARRHYLVGVAGRYRLGPAVTVLVSRWDAAGSLASTVLPVLELVSAKTGHAGTATVLVGREARIIASVPAPGPVTVHAPVVWVQPLELATGRVLVAFTAEADWARYVAGSSGAEPRWSPRRWANELRQIQRAGVAARTTTDPRGACGLAVPVWTRDRTVVCAIGCSAPSFLVGDLLKQSTVDALWEAAKSLSAELGCSDIPLLQPSQYKGA